MVRAKTVPDFKFSKDMKNQVKGHKNLILLRQLVRLSPQEMIKKMELSQDLDFKAICHFDREVTF